MAAQFLVLTITTTGVMQTHKWDTTNSTLLTHLQKAVDGDVDVVRFNDNIDMWVNDEGMFMHPINHFATAIARCFGLDHQPYYGPVVFTGGIDAEGETLPLARRQAAELLALALIAGPTATA